MNIDLEVFSLAEYSKLFFFKGVLEPKKFVSKIGQYLNEEIQNPYRDFKKIESYIESLKAADAKIPLGVALLTSAGILKDIKPLNLMLKSGADINFKNSQGQTALMIAAQAGLFDHVKRIHEAGGRMNDTDYFGRHALFHALSNHFAVVHQDLIKYLFDHKSDLYLVNKYEVTLDDLVEQRQSVSLYKILEQARAKEKYASAENLVNAKLTKDFHYM